MLCLNKGTNGNFRLSLYVRSQVSEEVNNPDKLPRVADLSSLTIQYMPKYQRNKEKITSDSITYNNIHQLWYYVASRSKTADANNKDFQYI